MTISNSDRTAGPFIGNGVTVSFPFTFKVFSRNDLLVAQTDVSGNETVLTLDADYSVTLNSNQSSTPGGTVTLMSALPTSYTLAMTSNIAMSQSLDLTNNGGFYPATINDTLDRIVVMIQQVSAKVAGGLYVGGAASVQTVAKLATSIGSSLIGFIQSGSGAVARTLQDRGRDTVSIKDFGAKGDGVTDDTAALQAAINYACSGNAKTLRWPDGVYLISASLKIPATGRGAGWKGSSGKGSYIKTAGGTFDLVKVAASYTRISGILFRPGAAQPCLRLYAANCDITGNQFLSAVNNSGSAILLSDVDPDTLAPVAGAYSHTIQCNVIGVTGYAFAHAIEDVSTSGIQACKINSNAVISDGPFKMVKGGGNSYAGNLLQSSTMAGAGSGIDIGANVVGETIAGGNYFEGFANGVLLRGTSNTNQVAYIAGNHFDACTNKVTSLGTINYHFANDVGTLFSNGWTDDYSSTTIRRWKTQAGADGIALDSNGHLLVNAASGSNHTINTTGAVQGDVLLSVNGAGTNAAYMQHVTGTAANGANTGLAIKAHGTTGRSINAGGTVNASGADYAEYMRKADGCGVVAKGQIIGINGSGEITDQWTASLTFATKSTDPSYVGGDEWFPIPRPQAPTSEDDAEAQAQYDQAIAAWEAAHEAARQCVDRIAFAGQVPVNVYGAQPGQYIVPISDGEGIKGIAKNESDMTLADYMHAVGRVIAIEADGRARIIVKVA